MLDRVQARIQQTYPSFELKPFGAVGVAGLSLALIQYFGRRRHATLLGDALTAVGLDGQAWSSWFAADDTGYRRFLYWTAWIALTYGALPLLYALFFPPRTRLRDLGLKLGGALGQWRLYLYLYAALFPVLIVVSQTEGFARFYPMWSGAAESPGAFLLWQLTYLPQFFFVELFFRGFLIFSFEKKIGPYAILVPVLPYCMVHFGKPLPEVLGAIVAALILGSIALRTRSIWLGVALHMSVALSMDLLALVARGGFG